MTMSATSFHTSSAHSGHTAPEILPPAVEDATQRATWKAVYTIVERGHSRKHWLRIGVAFVNRDGSLNVRLDAVPVNGQLHIREAMVRDGRDSSGELLASDREVRTTFRD